MWLVVELKADLIIKFVFLASEKMVIHLIHEQTILFMSLNHCLLAL